MSLFLYSSYSFSETKHDLLDTLGTGVQFTVSLYLMTASRSEGYGNVLWHRCTMSGKVSFHRYPGSKMWPARDSEGSAGLMGSSRTDRWRRLSRADGVNKETSGTGRKMEMMFFNRVEQSNLTRLFWGDSTNISRRRSQLLLIIGWNCWVSVVIRLWYLED